jgi:NRPS condensation-like uncharacterized protein
MEMKPLNIFQRCIRVWEQSHPYNAAQILKIAGAADAGKIAEAWNATLAASGLGNARVVGRRFYYEKAEPQDVIRVDEKLGLEAFITREMNRPFDAMPFRPFVLQDDGSHFMGVMYQHWVADSVSMRMLLREWFSRLHDPAKTTGRALHVPRGGFWRYFGPGKANWSLIDGVMSLIGTKNEFCRARRIENESGGQHVECSLHRLPDGTVDALRIAARQRKVTLNDMFLAALARACDEHGAGERRRDRDLAIGTIVDLRATSQENLDNTFGLFLGFTTMVVPAGYLRDRDRLLSNVAMQNLHQKESRAAQASQLRMAAGFTQAKLLSPKKLAAFYREYMPVMGGVSNVNMNRAWPAEYHPSVLLDYIRVAPTGPMVPVVFAATTIGKKLCFVLTRRASAVDEASGRELARTFIEELTARANMR